MLAEKPIRNHLTAGATLMLAAIGRACTVTSKDSRAELARTTSLEYLIRTNFSKIDSQQFWDCMDSFPIDKIEDAELGILMKVFEQYQIKMDSLFYDTTNFYTYISTTNSNCEIAKRGKNKQKRNDLRQIGLALMVTKDTMIPLFHHSYGRTVFCGDFFNWHLLSSYLSCKITYGGKHEMNNDLILE